MFVLSPSDKIGLLPGFGWVVDQSWFGDSLWSRFISTMLACWGLTPVGHFVWAFVSQATLLPIWRNQWRSFFPGDLSLGIGVAILVVSVDSLTAGATGWWHERSTHVAVLVGAMAIAVVITVVMDMPNMPMSALLSPSKQYHNLLLYGGYGYVVAMTLVAATFGDSNLTHIYGTIALFLLAITPWVCLVVQDARLPHHQVVAKQEYATPASYRLFWVIPVKGEYKK